MTYRAVVRHVRYWRGSVHRWSTVYQLVGTLSGSLGTSDAQAMLTADDAMCYPGGAVNGGAYECEIYNHATGGTAIASYIHFDWTSPGSWIGHSGAGWTATALGWDPAAEKALQVEWAMGLSSSGKPVFARKWYHACPPTAEAGGAAQIGGADITSLTNKANLLVGTLAGKGLTLGSASGRFAGTATVKAFYGNHQMPRGRKRKPLVTASGRYTGPTITLPD